MTAPQPGPPPGALSDPPSPDAVAAAALSGIDGISRATLRRLLERHRSPLAALDAVARGRAGPDVGEAARAAAQAAPLDALARRLTERATHVWWRGHPAMPVATTPIVVPATASAPWWAAASIPMARPLITVAPAVATAAAMSWASWRP